MDSVIRGGQAFFRGIGALSNFVLLTVVYIFGVGISGLLFRLTRLGRRRGPAAEAGSYWLDLNLENKTRRDHRRPF